MQTNGNASAARTMRRFLRLPCTQLLSIHMTTEIRTWATGPARFLFCPVFAGAVGEDCSPPRHMKRRKVRLARNRIWFSTGELVAYSVSAAASNPRSQRYLPCTSALDPLPLSGVNLAVNDAPLGAKEMRVSSSGSSVDSSDRCPPASPPRSRAGFERLRTPLSYKTCLRRLEPHLR